MPLKGAKYRMKKDSDVRLAFKEGEVVEAKNMKTGEKSKVKKKGKK